VDANQQSLDLLMSAGLAESTKTNEKNCARGQEGDEQNWYEHGDPLLRSLSHQRKQASEQYPA